MKDKIDSLLLHKPWMRYIDNDVLGVSDRLKSIDDGYFILFNVMSGKFEVHNTHNKKNTYCFVVPFDALDVRTVYHCQETLIANSDKLIRQMNENNRKLDKSRQKDFENNIEAASYELAQELQLAQDKDALYSGYKRTHGGVL